MKPIDIDELLQRNPKVDEATIRQLQKSMKGKKKTTPSTIPSPYGRRLPRHGDEGWQNPPLRKHQF